MNMKEIKVRTTVGQIHEELEKLATLATQKNCKIDMGLDILAYASLEYIKQLEEELNTCMIERNKFLDIIEETINKCKLEIRASSYQYEQRHKQQDLVYKVAHERILDILQKYEGVSNE